MGLFDFIKTFFGGPTEKPSPQVVISTTDMARSAFFLNDLYKYNQIGLTSACTVIFPLVYDSNSMDPLFDAGNNVILLDPGSPTNHEILCNWLRVGDVVVYDAGHGNVIHRIVEIGVKDGFRYFRCKGDNNAVADPYILRDVNIKYLMVGVLY